MGKSGVCLGVLVTVGVLLSALGLLVVICEKGGFGQVGRKFLLIYKLCVLSCYKVTSYFLLW